MSGSQSLKYYILSKRQKTRFQYPSLNCDEHIIALSDYSFFNEQFRVHEEMTLVLFFDKIGHPIGYAHCSTDLVSGVSFSVRDFVELALSIGAYSTLITHNHPSGDTTPSQIDIAVTKTILKILKPLQITLQDHIIYANDKYFSFKSNGLM